MLAGEGGITFEMPGAGITIDMTEGERKPSEGVASQ
jgi:hypothetical protein